MNLRRRLKESKNPIDIIWGLKPLEISPFDLKALLLISKARKSDCLSFLALEVKWWIKDNMTILKKRFVKKET